MVWIPIISTVFTLLVTAYGVYRSWQNERVHRAEVLASMARIAVRITEASYVRPLLKDRIEENLLFFLNGRSHAGEGLNVRRMVLFCRLQQRVCLTADEKKIAGVQAFNFLVEQLRTMHSAPVDVRSDARLKRHTQHLRLEIEKAYHLTPRPSNALIGDLFRMSGSVQYLPLADPSPETT